jgi:hypothetical protein
MYCDIESVQEIAHCPECYYHDMQKKLLTLNLSYIGKNLFSKFKTVKLSTILDFEYCNTLDT